MSRHDWATVVGNGEGSQANAAGSRPQHVHTTSNVSTTNLRAVGDVDWTAGDPRTVLAISALARSPRRRAQAPARGQASAAVRRVHTLELIGELDCISAPLVEREIERLCEEGVNALTLDLRRVTHIDRTGVSVIAFRSRLCRKRGFEIALIPGPARVHRAFARAGLLERLPFAEAGPAADNGSTAM
jgi:anti-anti-sigma factor